MTFKAKIVDGNVVLDQPLPLKDGTEVTIQAIEASANPPEQTVGEFLMQFAGIIKGDGLPTDGALNHDHYLYGTPKK